MADPADYLISQSNVPQENTLEGVLVLEVPGSMALQVTTCMLSRYKGACLYGWNRWLLSSVDRKGLPHIKHICQYTNIQVHTHIQ